MDIVVLFDMSRSGPDEPFDALVHFEETRDYITGAFLKEFLRKGDTFHLISFGETPRIELSRRIEGEGDYRTIIRRILLLYPVAQNGSLENVAAYAETFVNELPPVRQKKVVFFTARSGVTAMELGVRFNNENTDVYLATIPASFGTLTSGRSMMNAPPEPPVVVTAYPPVSPPVLIPPDSGSVELIDLEPQTVESPVIERLPDIMVTPVFPEFHPVWYDEPVLVNRTKVMAIILPIAGMILLFALILGYAVTWEKKDRADAYTAYTIEDYLYQMNKNAETEDTEDVTPYTIPVRGLLRKADEIKAQSA
jgi:hypothetical protein